MTFFKLLENEGTYLNILKQSKMFAKNKAKVTTEAGKKPDFLDLDKDGNKKEPMEKASDEKDEDEDIWGVLSDLDEIVEDWSWLTESDGMTD